jgi:hypothetical protein
LRDTTKHSNFVTCSALSLLHYRKLRLRDGKPNIDTSLRRKEGCESMMDTPIMWSIGLLSAQTMQKQAATKSLFVLTRIRIWKTSIPYPTATKLFLM